MISWWIFPAVLTAVIVTFIVWAAWSSGDVPFRSLMIWVLSGFGIGGVALFWALAVVFRVFA